MIDLQNLLKTAANPTTSTAAETVEADVLRGRRALTRRRLRRGSGGLAVVALATAGALALQQGPGSPAPAAGPTVRPHVSTPVAPKAIQLVAYTGEQPAGYTVDSVPAGWEIQGVNNFVLLIAPHGFADTRLDSFSGKIAVMLQSVDQTEVPSGAPVSVGSRPGVITREEGIGAQLFFTDGAGHKLDIQVPAELHWSDAQIAQFGTAVHVNPGAEAGRG